MGWVSHKMTVSWQYEADVKKSNVIRGVLGGVYSIETRKY